jgi:hypothetical protein
MAFNFPDNPSTNDTFTINQTEYRYDGVKWVVETGGSATLDSVTNNGNTTTNAIIVGGADVNGSFTADTFDCGSI